MAEFKRLSDVEVVAEPIESANVLIEENGVIKKAPKSEVGGEKADLVIALTMSLDYDAATADTTTIAIESGSMEAVAAALEAGKSPVVKCKRYCLLNSFDTSFPIAEGGVYDCNVLYYGGYVHFSFFTSNGIVKISLNIDDHDYLQVWFYPLVMSALQVI